MKITVYTIKDCAFSKQEKEYLNTNKLAYEEKNLETNKDFLTEMLAISNNFAGTPVTRVEKDDGSIAVLKGFTKAEFDTTFGFASPAEVLTKAGSTVPPVNDTPIATEMLPIPPVPVPTDLPPVETPVDTTPDPLKSVMDNLQTKSQPTEVQSTMPPVDQPPVASPTDQPTTEPLPPSAPAIPDFPAK